jgi:hypothetical protein
LCSSFAQLISGLDVTASNTPVSAKTLSRLLHVHLQRKLFGAGLTCYLEILNFHNGGQKSRHPPSSTRGGKVSAFTAGTLYASAKKGINDSFKSNHKRNWSG